MGKRAAKDALFDGLALVAKALASGRRIEIIDLLAQGERSVDEIATQIGQSVGNTSQHLRKLLRAGLVRTRRSGTRIHYSLSGPRVGELQVALRNVAAVHIAELDRLAKDYLGDRSTLSTLSQAELLQQLRSGDVVVVDVRPEVEYRSGHIAGAISVPTDELERWLNDLPGDVAVVAYCRGPYCVYADEAVRALASRGNRAVRLEDGFPEWSAAGLPVASDDSADHPS